MVIWVYVNILGHEPRFVNSVQFSQKKLTGHYLVLGLTNLNFNYLTWRPFGPLSFSCMKKKEEGEIKVVRGDNSL